MPGCANASTRCRCGFDLAEQEKEAAKLTEQTAAEDLWEDPNRAQRLMRRLSELSDRIALWRGLERQVNELSELLELSMVENDESIVGSIRQDSQKIEKQLDGLEFELLLSGEYADRGAILSIHAGAGGTESQDWASMLMRMYLRWAERRNFTANIIDETPGEEAGTKSVTIEIDGSYAYGYLRSERGVHRLVRISPFDSSRRRHTSFALVEVVPNLGEGDIDIEINPDDLKWEFFRSSGAGGQNVQKTSTAVRLIHAPTGLVVTCQNERSQIQNKEFALKVLRARLYEREMEKRESEAARLKGQHVKAGWGNQIRSYVLHPYNMVKDLRTDYETSNTSAVLDGELDPFIEAYLRWQVNPEEKGLNSSDVA